MTSKSRGTRGFSFLGGSGGTLADLLECVHYARPTERRPPGQQRVENRTQPMNVGRRCHRTALARSLLGGHVGRRTDDRAGAGQLAVPFNPLGQAEVADVRLPVGIDQDIRRLQVAVEDAPLVRMVNRVGRRRHQPGRSPGVGDILLQSLVEALPADQLHAEVMLILMPADLEDRHDVGMIEPGDRLGLVLEPADLVG